MEIGTDNLTPETLQIILDDADPNLVVYPKTDQHGTYGAFICVPEPELYDEMKDELPSDLRTVMDYAIGNRCDWLMVDVDAVSQDLPVYH